MTKEEYTIFIMQKLFTGRGYHSTWQSLLENIEYACNIGDFRLRKTAFNDIAIQAPMKKGLIGYCLKYEEVPVFIEQEYIAWSYYGK